MSTQPVPEFDGRSRILAAGLRLFGERGFAATSVRAVAAEADVSPALVLHHFGSKEGLRGAVDAEVLARFEAAADMSLGVTDAQVTVDQLVERLVANIGRVVSAPDLRSHLRRSLLEGGPSGDTIAARSFAIAKREVDSLASAGALRPGLDHQEAAVHLMVLLLGPLLLAPALEDELDDLPYSPAGLLRRTRATVELLTGGILRLDHGDA